MFGANGKENFKTEKMRLELDIRELKGFFADLENSLHRQIVAASMNAGANEARKRAVSHVVQTYNINETGPAGGSGMTPPGAKSSIKVKRASKNAPIEETVAQVLASTKRVKSLHFTKNKRISTGAQRRPMFFEYKRGKPVYDGRSFVATPRQGNNRLVLFRLKDTHGKVVDTPSGQKVYIKEKLGGKTHPSMFQTLSKPQEEKILFDGAAAGFSKHFEKEMSKLLRKAR